MQSLKIDLGEVRLCVNDDESRVIAFNPHDLSFAERFYAVLSDFKQLEKEYKAKGDALSKDNGKDEYGLPVNTPAQLAFCREVCQTMRNAVDGLFGAGASNAAFGDANTLTMFAMFFEGITPYIERARGEKLSKHTRPAKGPRGRVMK